MGWHEGGQPSLMVFIYEQHLPLAKNNVTHWLKSCSIVLNLGVELVQMMLSKQSTVLICLVLFYMDSEVSSCLALS